ncbi:hypothetical protein BDW22DRAFT_337717 [Trametopsis cervina]|nr:hypothetical protein BDW22DRAFT_337717 [Trametopsis cervina]
MLAILRAPKPFAVSYLLVLRYARKSNGEGSCPDWDDATKSRPRPCVRIYHVTATFYTCNALRYCYTANLVGDPVAERLRRRQDKCAEHTWLV